LDHNPSRSSSRSPAVNRPSGKKYKLEPSSPVYTPELPFYNGDDSEESDIAEDAQNREKRKFRCPFRREEDGMNCNKQDDSKVEILNHFYKFHFARICSGNVFEENLNCFYTRCHETFSTHEKLVKHIHKHDGGKESMFFVKYLIDNLEKEKKDEKNELSMACKAEKMEWENLLDISKQENRNLNENHAIILEEKMKETNEKESKLKEDLRYYKKRYESSKKKLEDDQKITKDNIVKMKDLKQENEEVIRESTKLKKVHEDSEFLMKGKVSDLKERNAELRGKLSIQLENANELKAKNEQLTHKYGNFGQNNESSLVQRNNLLEKQVELAMKQIKEKNAELRKKDDEILKLTFAGSVIESSNLNDTTHAQGEYVESD